MCNPVTPTSMLDLRDLFVVHDQQTCAHGAGSTGIHMSAAAAGKDKKVVVTGLGVVSGVGTGVEEFWKGLLAGESSINRIERFDPTPFKCQIGSEVLNYSCTVLYIVCAWQKSTDNCRWMADIRHPRIRYCGRM